MSKRMEHAVETARTLGRCLTIESFRCVVNYLPLDGEDGVYVSAR
jgi:hypothetical protein